MKKHALIMGDASTVVSVCEYLLGQNYKISLISSSREEARRIAEISNLPVILGDATDPHILNKSGMQHADLAISIFQSDEDNYVASSLCKQMLHIKKCISVIKDEKRIRDFYAAGVDSVICESASIIQLLQDEANHNLRQTLISDGRAKQVEMLITAPSSFIGKKIAELDLDERIICACIIRGNKILPANADTRLADNDRLICITSADQDLRSLQKLQAHHFKF